MDALTAMVLYGRKHGLTYGEVQTLFIKGRLTYEDIGADRPEEHKVREYDSNDWIEELNKSRICRRCMCAFVPVRSYREQYCSPECAAEAKRQRDRQRWREKG